MTVLLISDYNTSFQGSSPCLIDLYPKNTLEYVSKLEFWRKIITRRKNCLHSAKYWKSSKTLDETFTRDQFARKFDKKRSSSFKFQNFSKGQCFSIYMITARTSGKGAKVMAYLDPPNWYRKIMFILNIVSLFCKLFKQFCQLLANRYCRRWLVKNVF